MTDNERRAAAIRRLRARLEKMEDVHDGLKVRESARPQFVASATPQPQPQGATPTILEPQPPRQIERPELPTLPQTPTRLPVAPQVSPFTRVAASFSSAPRGLASEPTRTPAPKEVAGRTMATLTPPPLPTAPSPIPDTPRPKIEPQPIEKPRSFMRPIPPGGGGSQIRVRGNSGPSRPQPPMIG